jgi:hypothetical protein
VEGPGGPSTAQSVNRPEVAPMPSPQPTSTSAALSQATFWRRVDPEGEARAGPDGLAVAGEPTRATLVVPGLWDSGPDHWHSLWCASEPSCRRVELGGWSDPSRELWISRLDRAVARERRPVVLAAHSLGCLAVAWWAAEASSARLGKVVGALLVAPPDVDDADAHPLVRRFAPAPPLPLPFPALLVASRDDRYAAFDRLGELARCWGAGLVDAGTLGHINAESGLAAWPQGLALLRALHSPLALDARDLRQTTGYPVTLRSSAPPPDKG